MSETPSKRLIEQRVRSRIMEAVHTLAEGVGRVGFIEYFEQFYDFIGYREKWHSNSTITTEERAELSTVRTLLDEACDATGVHMSDVEFLASGWPARIQPVAQKAFALMLVRGWFNEEREENEPSALHERP
jgi:hypothetical protein